MIQRSRYLPVAGGRDQTIASNAVAANAMRVSTTNDPVARLLPDADTLARLTSSEPSGALRPLLAALDEPVESQILDTLRATKADLPSGSQRRA